MKVSPKRALAHTRRVAHEMLFADFATVSSQAEGRFFAPSREQA
jgi:hypothetical protein